MKEKINQIIERKEKLLQESFENREEFKEEMRKYLEQEFKIKFDVYDNEDAEDYPSVLFRGNSEQGYLYVEFDGEDYGLIDYEDQTDDLIYHDDLMEFFKGLRI